MANGLFAGINVGDFATASAWYQQLLGSEPSFYPNDLEAVWELADNQYLYIVQAPKRSGGSVNMIWADDLPSRIAAIAERGLEPAELEQHGTVGKYVFIDPDGNEIGIGGELQD